jgi:Arc/MetJ family transcription regulator
MVHPGKHIRDERCIAMKTTLNIDDALVEKASELKGIKEKTTLVKLGIEALLARESDSVGAGRCRNIKLLPARKRFQ